MYSLNFTCTERCRRCHTTMSHAILEVNREDGYFWRGVCCGTEQVFAMMPGNTNIQQDEIRDVSN